MGRHAEVLQRAEKRRHAEHAARFESVAQVMRKWSNWYGIAQPAPCESTPSRHDAAAEAAVVAGMSEEIVSYYDRSSVRCEQYRSLRTRLVSANTRQQHRVFTITSAVPKEGKTVTAANLAFSIAEIPHYKVLVVDADLRQGRLARILNVDASPGLADLLHGNASFDEVVRPLPLPNLFFVPAGTTRGRSATELLSRKNARAVFARFQREYHYTIVDTPPATTVADVGIIAQMTSGVIFIIRMHRTSEPIARHALKHMVGNNINVLGGLLIGENDPSSGYGQQYNYYRYYREEKQEKR